MKKTLQLFILLVLASNLAGQNLTLDPGIIKFDLDGTKSEEKIGYTLVNNDNTPFQWYWNIELGDDFPAEWGVQVCDQVLCWATGTLQMPLGNGVNNLGGGLSTNPTNNYVKIYTHGVAGIGEVKFCVYDNDQFENPIICSDFSTSITEADIAEINIFPNPANDYFQLSGDNDIDRIEVYNIVGKQVLTESNTTGQAHDISNFRNGLYIVRLISNEGKLVKSMRLSKR